MILSLKVKGDVISGQSLMLWFQKDSLDIVGFGTFRVGSGFPKLLQSIFPLCESSTVAVGGWGSLFRTFKTFMGGHRIRTFS